MRKDAMVGLGAAEKCDDPPDAVQDLRARQEAALGARQQCHKAEARAAARGRVAIVVLGHRVAALARHAALGVREIPEVPKRLPLHQRSEEHTSELQSLMRISYAVFCLKTKTNTSTP